MFKALLVLVTMVYMGHANASGLSCTATIKTWTMSGIHTFSNNSSTQYFEGVVVSGLPAKDDCDASGTAEKTRALKNSKGGVMQHDFAYSCVEVKEFVFAKLKAECVF